jgi:hypothetical protein
LDFFWVRPNLIEELEIHLRVTWIVKPRHEVRNRIAFLVPKIRGRKAANRHIGHTRRLFANMRELLHGCLGLVRAEGCFFANPIGAFPRDRSLGELVSKLDFELSPTSISPKATARRLGSSSTTPSACTSWRASRPMPAST